MNKIAVLCLLLLASIVPAEAGAGIENLTSSSSSYTIVPSHAIVRQGTINYSVFYGSNFTPCDQCRVTWSTNNSRGRIDANSGVMEIIPGEKTVVEVHATFAGTGLLTAIVEVCDDVVGCEQIPQPTPQPTQQPILQPIVVTREIAKQGILQGETTLVTVSVEGDAGRPFSIIEYIPDGWDVKIMSSSADAERLIPGGDHNSNYYEWVWLTSYSGAVSYYITAPRDSEGAYIWLYGTVTDEETGTTVAISGKRSISVGVKSYYKSLGLYDYILETRDLLKAARDWQDGRVPPGFSAPITIKDLMELAEEWRNQHPSPE